MQKKRHDTSTTNDDPLNIFFDVLYYQSAPKFSSPHQSPPTPHHHSPSLRLGDVAREISAEADEASEGIRRPPLLLRNGEELECWTKANAGFELSPRAAEGEGEIGGAPVLFAVLVGLRRGLGSPLQQAHVDAAGEGDLRRIRAL